MSVTEFSGSESPSTTPSAHPTTPPRHKICEIVKSRRSAVISLVELNLNSLRAAKKMRGIPVFQPQASGQDGALVPYWIARLTLYGRKFLQGLACRFLVDDFGVGRADYFLP